ncbi:MAG: EamA family transporter [Acidobacteria bacterium]|nr:EamA family transporter [Acidobacteriota bacterium]
MKWLLVGVIVFSTVMADLLQSREMKAHGEVEDFRPRGIARLLASLARRWTLMVAVGFMALSFFSFMALLSMADLSFAVPATAAGLVVETVMARFYLKERVGRKRWLGACLVACGVALLAL